MTKRWALPIVAVVLGACDGAQTADLVAFVENAHKDSKPAIEPLPEIRLYEKFVYSASALSDPFSAANLLPEGNSEFAGGTGPDTNRRLEPLEQFVLGDLVLVGTMTRSGESWAIIQAPDGTVHRVTIGNYVGENFGRVIQVANNRVELKELVLVEGNRWVESDAFLSFGETASPN